MNILAIETSTARGSVALLCEKGILLNENFIADRNHTSVLYSTIEKAGALVTSVDLIAVGLGPGSYAGVRVAIATAIGLSLAWDAAIVGIPSVAVLETGERGYLVVGDARRGLFYFSHVVDGECMEGPLLMDEGSLAMRLSKNEMPVFATASFAQAPSALIASPSALLLARLAAAGRGIVAREELEPLYLREPHITLPNPQGR